jgi:hypothetical protein
MEMDTNEIPNMTLTSVEDLKLELENQNKRNERLIKSFEKKTLEVFRSFRNLTGFKFKLIDKQIKLICDSKTDNYLLFRVYYFEYNILLRLVLDNYIF